MSWRTPYSYRIDFTELNQNRKASVPHYSIPALQQLKQRTPQLPDKHYCIFTLLRLELVLKNGVRGSRAGIGVPWRL